MSVKVSTWVWHESEAAGTDLLVLLALADIASDEGRCWPSVGTLAIKTRLSRRTIQRSLSTLCEQGVLRRSHQTGMSNQYVIITAASPRQDDAPVRQSDAGDNLSGCVTHDAGGASPMTQGGASLVSPNTSYTRQRTVKRASEAGDRFAEFYAMYPRKEGRGAARKAWTRAIKNADPEQIIAGLKEQTPTLLAKERRFIPHPATWLNQERWADEAGTDDYEDPYRNLPRFN